MSATKKSNNRTAHGSEPELSNPRVVRDCTLDWAKIDTVVARDGSLDPTAKALYMALATFADKSSRVTDADPNGFDVPTRKALAACIGRDVRAVDRATERLEAYRISGLPLLTVDRRRDPQNPKSHLPNVYRLLDHELWDARAAERHAVREAARSASEGGVTDVATPSVMDVATPPRGGVTGVATPSVTSVAVPITTQKNTTHRVREDANVEASAVVIGVGSGGGVPQADLDALRAIVRPEVHDMLTLDERGELAAVLRRLLDTGWTADAIRARRPDRRINSSTTHPATHIRRALDTLDAEAAPVNRAEAHQTGSAVAAIDADRAARRSARQSPVRDEAARLAVEQGADAAAAADWAQSTPLPTIERWVKNGMSVPTHLLQGQDGDGNESLNGIGELADSLGTVA